MPSPFDEFVCEAVSALKSGRIVVFCGAGISFHSGLPMATQLVRAVLGKLDLRDDERDRLLSSQLPFEAFVETVHAESDVTPLLDLFKLGEPNTNHMLLAKLVKRGHLRTICTVNFDELIERALDAEGFRLGKDYEVAYDDNGFDAMQRPEGAKVRLIKIHGSAVDSDSMAITLRQVASKTLSAQRRGLIERIFSLGEHDAVLVLGYSCSDVFDISPHIAALPRKDKQILFVNHHPTLVNQHRSAATLSLCHTSARRTRFAISHGVFESPVTPTT